MSDALAVTVRMPGHLGDREVHLSQALAVLGNHEVVLSSLAAAGIGFGGLWYRIVSDSGPRGRFLRAHGLPYCLLPITWVIRPSVVISAVNMDWLRTHIDASR
jgi:hypothetical protein